MVSAEAYPETALMCAGDVDSGLPFFYAMR